MFPPTPHRSSPPPYPITHPQNFSNPCHLSLFLKVPGAFSLQPPCVHTDHCGAFVFLSPWGTCPTLALGSWDTLCSYTSVASLQTELNAACLAEVTEPYCLDHSRFFSIIPNQSNPCRLPLPEATLVLLALKPSHERL